ncbi:MAG TPA: ABC transporter ATP-binding protein [Caulobacterales bacterium]|nr:ABC transporter ATP-binding protein [Caulobacterales bacterium]
MSQDIAIRAEGLTKRYRLGGGPATRDSIGELIKRGLDASRRAAPARPDFIALNGASFEIRRGENVGIIGSNGAGKSTLLKILSRIVEPSAGRALVAGRVGALLEVGTGFHLELTGRENIFLYGSILGMSKWEVETKFDEIVEFSEIGPFIDTPVKRYSSGMFVRLAFAVAAHLQPDILLLDEVLAVGDAAFQRKCMAFARQLQEQDATILFVSHNMFSIKTMCDRVIYLNKGRIEYDGPTDGGIEMYDRGAHLSVVPWAKDDSADWPIVVTDVEVLGEDGAAKVLFDLGERMRIRVHYDARDTIEAANFMVAFKRADDVGVSVYANELDDFDPGPLKGAGVIELLTPPLKLVAEKYTIHVVVRRRGTQDLLCAQVGRSFHVRDELIDTDYGVFHEPAKWRIVDETAALARLADSAGRR